MIRQLVLAVMAIWITMLWPEKPALAACPPGAAYVEEIAENVFLRKGQHALMSHENHGGIANIGFILGAQKILVIDSGGSICDGKRILRAISQISDLPIAYIVNTHIHPDHIFGNLAFTTDLQHPPPQWISHHNLPRAMAQRGRYYLEQFGAILAIGSGGEQTGLEHALIPPDLLVKDKMLIDLGGRIVEITAHLVAHTDHDLTVFDRQSGGLWMGDLLFESHIPVIDGSLTGFLAVLEKLAQRKDVKYFVPGHGTPGGHEITTRHIGYLRVLVQDLRRLIASGASIGEAVLSAGNLERKKWLLFDEYHKRNVITGFVELEWE